jgi:hypothetical protein
MAQTIAWIIFAASAKMRVDVFRAACECLPINKEKHMNTETFQTNMPWAVYRCDLIGPGNRTPKNEMLVSGHVTAREAMDAANKAKRSDRKHSYTVGAA